MMDIPTISTWRGKRIEDECSREELLACIEYLAGKWAEYQQDFRAVALGKVEMMKRGEV